jgi:hypothetical protein
MTIKQELPLNDKQIGLIIRVSRFISSSDFNYIPNRANFVKICSSLLLELTRAQLPTALEKNFKAIIQDRLDMIL